MEPSASVTLAVVPDLIPNAHAQASLLTSILTPASVTSAFVPADTTMRSVFVVKPGTFMETTMGVPVLSSSTLLP